MTKKYYYNNRDKVLAHKREYYRKHKKEIIKKQHLYYLKNRDEILKKKLEYQKEYHQKNRIRINQRSKKYRQKDIEKWRKYDRDWRKKKWKEDDTFRYIETVRHKDKQKINLDNKKCELCGSAENLHRHHISYNPSLVQILCRSCHNKLHSKIKR